MTVGDDWLWNLIVPVLLWGAAGLVCVALGAWLSGVIGRFAEEGAPGRRGCPKCGYDVRATPARCPECGHALPPETTDEAAATEANADAEDLMPIYTIPEGAGPFVVVRGSDGGFAVAEERAANSGITATQREPLFIPCRNEEHARDNCDRLNCGEHDGTVQVNLLDFNAESEANRA